ncbi:hypothetical protein BGZ54_008416, partial [Gamsiella multidivaricata]
KFSYTLFQVRALVSVAKKRPSLKRPEPANVAVFPTPGTPYRLAVMGIKTRGEK